MSLQDKTSDPLRIGVLIFPGFQSLDVFGPVDAFNVLSRSHPLTFAFVAHTLDAVPTQPPDMPHVLNQSVLPTHTFASPPPLDVLLVPGGAGTRANSPPIEAAIAYIKDAYPTVKYLMTVCTGSGLAAKAGVLDGKRATTNKRAFKEITAWNSKVDWVARARWVTDGNIWTSSGISAGIDVALAWIAHVYNDDTAQDVANMLEYERCTDSTNDPFAALYGLT